MSFSCTSACGVASILKGQIWTCSDWNKDQWCIIWIIMFDHKVKVNGIIHIHTERDRDICLMYWMSVVKWTLLLSEFLTFNPIYRLSDSKNKSYFWPLRFISLMILQTTLNDRTNNNYCSLTVNKQNSLRVVPLLYMWSWHLQWNRKRFNDFQMAFSQAGMCYVMSFGNLVQCEHQSCLAWERGWMPLALKALSSCWTGKLSYWQSHKKGVFPPELSPLPQQQMWHYYDYKHHNTAFFFLLSFFLIDCTSMVSQFSRYLVI